MKLNNKGMTIIEIVVTFTLIMFLVTGLLIIVLKGIFYIITIRFVFTFEIRVQRYYKYFTYASF